jgi:hypothetical protein
MAVAQEYDDGYLLGIIARSLAYLCLCQADLAAKDIATKSMFLEGLGVSRRDIASMLNTTEDTVKVGIYQAKKAGKKNNGKTNQKRAK